MKKKNSGIFIGFGVAVFFYYLYSFFDKNGNRQPENDFNNFNSSNIKGVIVDIGEAHHMNGFKVNTSAAEFIFHPKIQSENDFDALARIDDSIIKPAFSDTLILKKSQTGKVYKILFFSPLKN